MKSEISSRTVGTSLVRPWRLTGTALAFCVAAALPGAAGCKSSTTSPAKPAPAAKPEAAKAGDAKAAPAPKAGDAKAAPAPAPAKADGNQAALEGLSAEARVREEKRRALVGEYAALAEKLYGQGEWEAARSRFYEVLELDPGNAQATRRLEEIGAHLNDRGASAAESFRDAVEERRVRAMQAKAEVAAFVSAARRLEQEQKFDEALRYYERALVIVGVQDFAVDFNPDEKGLRNLIAEAKSRKADADARRRASENKEAQRLKEAEAAREKAQTRATIVTLFRDANAAMEADQFKVAQGLAERVLEIDPPNKEGRRLRDLAYRADLAAYEKSIQRSLREEWKNVFEELQRQATPMNDMVAFPATWNVNEGISREPSVSSAAAMTSDPRDAAIHARLDATRATLNISDEQTSIRNVLAHLSELTGINIVLDPKAAEGKSDADLALTSLQLGNPVPVREILGLITLQKNLSWRVKDGVVLVTTTEAARGASILDLYDVKDITVGILDFPAEEINLQPSGGGGFNLPSDASTEPRQAFQGDNIKELIQQNIDQEIWGNGSNIDFKEPGTLVVKAPLATHAKIRKLLSDLRNTGGMQVAVETRFITVSDNFLQDIGVDMRGLGDDSLGAGIPGKGANVTFDDVLAGNLGTPLGIGTGTDAGVFYNFIHGQQDLRARVENLYDVALGKPGILTGSGGTSLQATYLDDTQVEAILRAVEKSERSTQVIAPKITAYNNQRSNVQVLNQVSYISDFDVEIAQLAQIGDPIIQQLRDGVVLDFHPVISADKRYVTMELRPTVAILQRPIATFQTTLGNGPPVAIQLPEIRVQRVRTTVTIPDGGTLLLGGLRFYEEQRLDSTVPFLDKIPILSFFWRRQGTFIERRNLLILLKATIIRLEEHEPNVFRRG
jgi:type II secretory pathway component GspD/PulD (secretin)